MPAAHCGKDALRQRSFAAFCGSSFISRSVLLSLRPPPAQRLMEPALTLARMADHQCMMRGWFGHVSRHAVRYTAEVYLSKRAGLQASKPNRFLFCVFFLVACVGVDALPTCLVHEAGTVFALADF